jgi:Holliday junction resolvase
MMDAVKIREAAVERELMRRVQALGGVCEKVRCSGRRGCFDRLVVLPGARVYFVELKRPRGGRLSAHQRQWAQQFAALGVAIVVLRNSADIDALLLQMESARPRWTGAVRW